MDVGIGGVLFIWFMFFWPMITVMLFVCVKSTHIRDKAIFIPVAIIVNYAVGILLNFIFPASIATFSSQVSMVFGFGEMSSFRSNFAMAIMFGVHILIPFTIYLGFKKDSKKIEKNTKSS
jgi:hypothetical protein